MGHQDLARRTSGRRALAAPHFPKPEPGSAGLQRERLAPCPGTCPLPSATTYCPSEAGHEPAMRITPLSLSSCSCLCSVSFLSFCLYLHMFLSPSWPCFCLSSLWFHCIHVCPFGSVRPCRRLHLVRPPGPLAPPHMGTPQKVLQAPAGAQLLSVGSILRTFKSTVGLRRPHG